MLSLIYANILLFCIYIIICFTKFKKNEFFYTIIFIFKIIIHKKNFKLIGKNSSLFTFFLTTHSLHTDSFIDFQTHGISNSFVGIFPVEVCSVW